MKGAIKWRIRYYILDKDHSKECIELNIKNIKIETNIIGSYNDYIKACFNYLDTKEDEKKIILLNYKIFITKKNMISY